MSSSVVKIGEFLILARFILEMDHPSWTNLHTNWASNLSSSDNSSVYKYGQTDVSSVEKSYLDSSSMKTNYPVNLSGRMIRLFACIYTQTTYQANYRCLSSIQVYIKFIQDGWSISSINRAIIISESVSVRSTKILIRNIKIGRAWHGKLWIMMFPFLLRVQLKILPENTGERQNSI